MVVEEEPKEPKPKTTRVAIVGAGMGAAVLADRLSRERRLGAVDIVVFERDSRIGGRAHSAEHDGVALELGGAIIFGKNWFVRNLTDSLGFRWGRRKTALEQQRDQRSAESSLPSSEAPEDCDSPSASLSLSASSSPLSSSAESVGELRDESVGVWNGKGFVAHITQRWWVDIPSMLWNYGLSPKTCEDVAMAAAERFFKVYDHLASGEYFEDVLQMYTELGLLEEISSGTRDYMLAKGVSEKWIDELVTALTRTNYCQDARDLNALAALVTIAGSGDNLMAPEAGWTAVVEAALQRAKATVHLDTDVLRVRRISSSSSSSRDGETVGSRARRRFVLETEPAEAGKEAGEFDYVVVAAPLESSGLSLVGDSMGVTEAGKKALRGSSAERSSRREFQTVFATALTGTPSEAYFGRDPPDVILTADHQPEGADRIPFTAISKRGEGLSGVPVYKIFTTQRPSAALWDALFENRQGPPTTRAFQAYPKLPPLVDGSQARQDHLLPFVLAPGVFYANAIETPFSCLEASAVAAQNIANKIVGE